MQLTDEVETLTKRATEIARDKIDLIRITAESGVEGTWPNLGVRSKLIVDLQRIRPNISNY
jgi:hypothetical protein